jgi:hypothetical protein
VQSAAYYLPPAIRAGVAATAADGSAVSPESLVRLLLVSQFAGFTEAVPCYENLPTGSYVDVQIDDYHSKYAHDTAVISWRWSRPKPPSAEAARSPVSNPVPVALVEYVSHLSERDNMKYLWLDWSCAPQYPEDLSATVSLLIAVNYILLSAVRAVGLLLHVKYRPLALELLSPLPVHQNARGTRRAFRLSLSLQKISVSVATLVSNCIPSFRA